MAEDETDILLYPPLRACWSPRGQTRRVLLSGQNERRVVFGALNLLSGRRILLPRDRQRGDDFRAFLRWVRWNEPDGLIVLLLDEDASHTATASQVLAEELDIRLLWLPVRSPHLNLMEPLWGLGKQVICADRQIPQIDNLVRKFIDYLRHLSDEEALHSGGVQSADFWLGNVMFKYFRGPA